MALVYSIYSGSVLCFCTSLSLWEQAIVKKKLASEDF